MPRRIQVAPGARIKNGDVLLWRGIELGTTYERPHRSSRPYWWGSHPTLPISAQIERIGPREWRAAVWVGSPGSSFSITQRRRSAFLAVEAAYEFVASHIRFQEGVRRQFEELEEEPRVPVENRPTSWERLLDNDPV